MSINPKYQTCDEISEAVRKVILDIKSKNIFAELNGWRNEEYNVKERFSSPEVLFRVERAASSLLGIKCYGSHINGYIKKDGKYYLWIARRSKTKPTFPGMLDNFVSELKLDYSSEVILNKRSKECWWLNCWSEPDRMCPKRVGRRSGRWP